MEHPLKTRLMGYQNVSEKGDTSSNVQHLLVSMLVLGGGMPKKISAEDMFRSFFGSLTELLTRKPRRKKPLYRTWMVWVMNHAPSIGFCPPFEKIKTNGKDLLPLHPNQQKFQIPKIEVLYKPSKAIFWGWGFPYIALTYSLYRSFVPPFSGPEMFGDPNAQR